MIMLTTQTLAMILLFVVTEFFKTINLKIISLLVSQVY